MNRVLSPSFDGVQWLRDIYRDQASESPKTKCAHGPKFLARSYVALGKLLQKRVASKSCCRVGRLSCCSGYEALKEASDASFPPYYAGAM